MIISHKHQFIFIHVYKVAGTSVTHALKRYAVFPNESLATKVLQTVNLLPSCRNFNSHVTAEQLQESIGTRRFNRYFKFAFVRNPWDWQVSLYKYILKNKAHYLHQLVQEMDGFESYVEWRVSQDRSRPRSLQKSFVSDSEGNLIVDFIGRYEHLQKDFKIVLDRLGLEAQLPDLNKTQPDDYRRYYNQRTCEMVLDYYREDVEFFGYEAPVLIAA